MFGIEYLKAPPTTYILHYKAGKVKREGAGLSFLAVPAARGAGRDRARPGGQGEAALDHARGGAARRRPDPARRGVAPPVDLARPLACVYGMRMATLPSRKRRAADARAPASRPARTAPPRMRKAPTNLSLPMDLVRRAKALGLNLSRVVERALAAAIREAEQGRWLSENEQAIEQYNAFVERHGAFSDDFRAF